MLGCLNPILGQIWTNSNIGLKMSFKNVTQWLGLSVFDPQIVFVITITLYIKVSFLNISYLLT